MTNRELNQGKKEEELEEKVVKIRRVSKKTEGGNRLGFTALVVVGDKNGRVGSALCRAPAVVPAIRKAVKKARKQMIKFPLLGEARTIPHPVEVKRGAAHVLLKPAGPGTGIIVGGAMRPVVEVGGIENIVGKCLGTNNPKSNVDATIEALKRLKRPEERLVKR